MNQKIYDYVRYYFRYDNSNEKEDKINEVYCNLVDKYEDLVKNKQVEEQEAYIETIKTIGNFNSKSNEK